ncbi:MAG: hypothetical protein AAF689_14945 [Pseudomonadota bacterium]
MRPSPMRVLHGSGRLAGRTDGTINGILRNTDLLACCPTAAFGIGASIRLLGRDVAGRVISQAHP